MKRSKVCFFVFAVVFMAFTCPAVDRSGAPVTGSCCASELHTSLYYAVQNDDMDTLKTLLKKAGPAINEEDGSLLRGAVGLGKDPVVIKMLLDAGADPNLKDPNSGDTALHVAMKECRGDNNEVILKYAKFLVGKGANVSQKRTSDGYTPLHAAAKNEQMDRDIFAALLQSPTVDVNVRCDMINESADGAWQHLFYLATRPWDFKNCGGAMAQMLIDKGADLKATTTKEASQRTWNVLHLCCGTANDHVDVVEVLLKAGMGIEALTGDENLSPLHIAMNTNNPKICTLLLEKGADYNSKDSEGTSVLSHARGWGTDKHYESAKVVIDWAASHK